MDGWGVAGCRERRAEIVEWLKSQERKASWGTRLFAAFRTVTSGMWWLNPLDPLGSLTDEAIRRAEAKELKPVIEKKEGPAAYELRWAYGVTTAVIPQGDDKTHTGSVKVALSRRGDLLPRTLASLKAGGFPTPRLFVDGDNDAGSWEREFGLPVTCRYPLLRTAGNWLLALYELYIRDPAADRYAIFQDDLACVRNLRAYLERCVFPARGYLNLFTFPVNQQTVEKTFVGWFEAKRMPESGSGRSYHGKMQQYGKGAVGLVFDRGGALTLLANQRLAGRFSDVDAGWKKIDGGVVESMNQENYWEWCHSPSLLYHTGTYDNGGSSTGNNPQAQADSFPGDSFDALRFMDDPAYSVERGFGEKAYAGYPAPDRERYLAAWRQELDAVRRAIADDERRLAGERDPRQVRRLRRALENYQQLLKTLERNDPPYLVAG